jgi:hypothetical protein
VCRHCGSYAAVVAVCAMFFPPCCPHHSPDGTACCSAESLTPILEVPHNAYHRMHSLCSFQLLDNHLLAPHSQHRLQLLLQQ